ncbi:coatomer subunit beta [Entomophthora muscae]|uniref:Coatomer subunit beta n=1 Tax=Entomophthora muscae TaxID=34485 RepID=A0ACC2RUL9_9FUNG|nr:coatomer subunit beta [Entomophthora muscae]
MSVESVYTIFNPSDSGDLPTVMELKNKFEKGNDRTKIEGMEQLISLCLGGEPCDQLLMHVIRFILPSKNKHLKKLLHFYWETCPKYSEDGKLKQEMILVCNAIRNDLQHPNEFIRGATLRFLCKLRDPELLEPLVPSCRLCLEHRLSYVRKNAVLAISSIYRHNPNLIPDAPEMIQSFLVVESDFACKRNAFNMLARSAPEKATEYFMQIKDQISELDELLQLAIIEHLRKVATEYTPQRALFVKTIIGLLDATSPSVKFEAATTVALLTTHPRALSSAGLCFLNLAKNEADNNVKLITLDRFETLRGKLPDTFHVLIMDLLKVLGSSPDLDVLAKVLSIAQKMIVKRNVQEVVGFLTKELARSGQQDTERTKYRELLISAIHSCAIRFPEVAPAVVATLMGYFNESATSTAVDVVTFIKEIAELIPELRSVIVESLLQAFDDIKPSRAIRGALWVMGEYSSTPETIQSSWHKIREAVGDVPIVASEQALLDKIEDQPDVAEHTSSAPRVNADGTYATEASFTAQAKVAPSSRSHLRSLLIVGDFYLGSTLATTLTKLVLQFSKLSTESPNAMRAEAMLMMTSIIRLGQSHLCLVPIDNDNYDRIMGSIKVLGGLGTDVEPAYLEDSRQAYARLAAEDPQKSQTLQDGPAGPDVDDKVMIRQLAAAPKIVDDEYTRDLTLATGEITSQATKLDKIVGLSGFSDAIYCEAVVEVHQRDIYLELLMVNQTNETLQNVTLEFATIGDLRLVEKPAPCTLAPNAFHSSRASVKVSSTETGAIYGTLSFDKPGASGSEIIILNDLHVDIMDYIQPANCTMLAFRNMWTEFEWENKVGVTTKINNLAEFLQLILKATNMGVLFPVGDLSNEDCNFLSANLYARTLFGEDALANLSIEKTDEGTISGHVRIRSKAQGLALSLGDKVTSAQKVQ